MIWLNLQTRTLHSPEYIGSDPSSRATWLNVSLWCAQQENGGRIKGADTWKDRQWQQTCGVTRREVQRASKLLSMLDGEIVVWGYPQEKESEVQAKREAGRLGGKKSGKIRTKQNPDFDEAQLQAELQAPCEADGQAQLERKGKEGKGKEGKGRESGASNPASQREASRTMPANLDTPVFRSAWERWLVHYAEAFGDGRPIPSATADLHLGMCLKFGPTQAVEAIDNAISRKLREPGLPFTNRSGASPVRQRHQPPPTEIFAGPDEDPFK